MKELKDILYQVSLTSTYGNMNIAIGGICFDSRKVERGFLFVAIRGTVSDGHAFISKAIDLGATVIVCERLPESITESVTFVTVKNTANALGIMA